MHWLHQLIFPIVRIYWRIARPTTFGARVIITDASDKRTLLIRHTYGNRDMWHLPGGGYNPKKESAVDAACREVREELAINLQDLHYLGDYKTAAQGKADTVQIYQSPVTDPMVGIASLEIAEYAWADINEIEQRDDVYRITRHAVRLLNKVHA